MNLYAYAGNNPVAFTDPFGLCRDPDDKCPNTVREVVEAAEAYINEKINQVTSFVTSVLDALTPGGNMVRASTGVDPRTGAQLSGGQQLLAAGTGVLQLAGMAALASPLVSADAIAAATTATAPTRINSAGVLGRSAQESGPMHNFPAMFDDAIFAGQRTSVSNSYRVYRTPGTVNGRAGLFEIGVRPSTSGRTEVITHRLFRPSP